MYQGHFKHKRNQEEQPDETVNMLMELFCDEFADDDNDWELSFTPDDEENPIYFKPINPDVRKRMKQKKENLEKTIEKLGGKKK